MKKTVFFLIFLLVLPVVSSAEIEILKLRTSFHSGFLRIVLEGNESILGDSLVHQRSRGVVVTFPDSGFTIQTEKMVVAFKRFEDNKVIFYPSDFRGLKVFNLKYPNRLVIDVYVNEDRDAFQPRLTPPLSRKSESLPGKEDRKGLPAISNIVIDPGHGGFESGIVGDNYREKNMVLDIARKLSVLINKGHAKGLLTRGSDRFMAQAERALLANNSDADIFIALHVGRHEGFMIYFPLITRKPDSIVAPYLANRGQGEYVRESSVLMNAMKDAISENFGEDMVSVRPLPYSILSRIQAAAVMIELPSFDDAEYIEELKEEIANTLYKGVYIYEEIKTH